MPLPQIGQLPPAIADIAAAGLTAQRIEPPQQGRGVRQAQAQRPLGRADRPVIKRQRRVVLAELHMEQRLVPPDMHLVHMLRHRPQCLARAHPAEPVFRPSGHLHDMRDRVMRPKAQRLQLRRFARLVLGARVIAGLLGAERMKRQQRAVARHVLRPQWQRARRAVADAMKPSEKPVAQCRRLMRDDVERVLHQMRLEHCDGGGARALHDLRQCREMRLLALVQGKAAGGLDERRGLRHQPRVVGDRKHPGLAESGHRKIGRRFARLVEQPDRVAMHEIERPHRLFIDRGRRCRRARQPMPLCVLDHVLPRLFSAGRS